ncbi:MAG: phosphotransferase, partial [Alphaproteobacteria bacterium]|nr:phosphotransferase [Alphaproteobacteria bacterium]
MAGSDQTQDRVIAFLSDPTTHGGEIPQRIETHGAIIFLLTDRAYKLKRAVEYFFMDFSTLEKRQQACQNEIRLNRRTAPDLYRGTRMILQGPNGLTLGDLDTNSDAAVEIVIEMSRFKNTFADVPPTENELRLVAVAIAEFHNAQPSLEKVGGSVPLGKTLAGNLKMLAEETHCDQETVAQLKSSATDMLKRVTALLDQRASSGSVRHCHGDLHLANICRWQGVPTLFDCIEFNDSYAHIDVLYDLAFLIMDLDAHDRRDGAAIVFNRYLERRPTDISDLRLMPLFLSMRAQVRAKVG